MPGHKRVIEWAHQHQYADALATLDPTTLNQLVNSAAQGVAVYLVARGKLMLGGQIVTAAIMMTKLLLSLAAIS